VLSEAPPLAAITLGSFMYQKLKGAIVCTGLALSALLTGCAGVAPNYSPSLDNVEALKKSGATQPVKTGSFGVTPGMKGAQTLSMRGSTLSSPVGNNYADYLAQALQEELKLAKLYNPESGIEISGTLITNNVDAGGISTNSGQIEARFVVSSMGKELFNKVKRIERTWESSFVGSVAIPRAASNYNVMVQSLIASLVADPDFVNAIKTQQGNSK
jgi:hypothetical protein